MKKNILLLSIVVSSLLEAKIDFSKYIEFQQADDIKLTVTNIKKDNTLNLRKDPSIKSKIIYQIPYDAKNIVTYDKNIVEKIKKNLWTPIKVEFKEGYFEGWVQGKYIKIYDKYSAISTEDLLVIYPSFLDATTKDNWIKLNSTKEIDYNIRCNEKNLDELKLFDYQLKVYYTLLDVFAEENLDNYKSITKNDWFKKETKEFKKVNYFGLKGYKRVAINQECGVNFYYFRLNGKVLVIKEPFGYKSLDNKDKIEIPDKKDIIKYIIHNLKVF